MSTASEASHVKIPSDATLSARALFRRLFRLMEGTDGTISEELGAATARAAKREYARIGLREPSRMPALPKAWLDRLGAARWKRDDPRVHLMLIVLMRGGEEVAARFYRMVLALHAVQRTITEAISLEFVREIVRDYPPGRIISAGEHMSLRWRLVGKAAEDTIIHDARFLEVVEREATEVEALAKDAKFMARNGLVSLDTRPLVSTKVSAPGVKGSTDARRMYVDIAVLFRGETASGQAKYLVKLRGQSKLMNVEQLITSVAPDGELVVGQLVKDEVRAGRGPWHFSRIRIEQDMLIREARHTKLMTFGSREMTSEELARLRDVDGIRVEHMVHGVPYQDFYRWADEFISKLGVKIK